MPRRKSNSGPSTPPPPPPPPQSTNRIGHPIIVPAELAAGCVIWLPPRNTDHEPVKCNCCEDRELDDAGYNHPVIVLSMKQKQGSYTEGDLICCVACVTTYSDTNISTYLKKRLKRQLFQKSLPIKDCKAEDISSYGISFPNELELERNQRLQKQSYVRLEHCFEVPISMLRQYGFRSCHASKLRLTQKSYSILMSELLLEAETWHTTKTLFKTAKQRLSALAVPTVPAPPQQHLQRPTYDPHILPHVTRPSTTRPATSVPVYTDPRPYVPYIPTYPTYQPPSYQQPSYGTSGPRWSAPNLSPVDEKSSSSMLGVFVGVLFLAGLAWWRYRK